ncbi:MAG: efflux RND transporter permease subunit [Pseudomonadota bacterium]
MNGIVSWFAKNAVAANLLMIVAFIGGTMAFINLEREFFPTALVNGASVDMTWQGASPQDVESELIVRLEESVADIDGLKRITSVAREGSGSVFIEAENSTDMAWFIDEVTRRVNRINQFPDAAFEPQIRQWEAQNWFFGMAVHGDVDARTLKRTAEEIRDEMALLPGGQRALVDAVLTEEVSIEVTEESLRRYGLTFMDVANAVRTNSINSSGGRVQTETGDVSIQTRELGDTADDLNRSSFRKPWMAASSASAMSPTSSTALSMRTLRPPMTVSRRPLSS